jgi:hypothetical protein
MAMHPAFRPQNLAGERKKAANESETGRNLGNPPRNYNPPCSRPLSFPDCSPHASTRSKTPFALQVGRLATPPEASAFRPPRQKRLASHLGYVAEPLDQPFAFLSGRLISELRERVISAILPLVSGECFQPPRFIILCSDPGAFCIQFQLFACEPGTPVKPRPRQSLTPPSRCPWQVL